MSIVSTKREQFVQDAYDQEATEFNLSSRLSLTNSAVEGTEHVMNYALDALSVAFTEGIIDSYSMNMVTGEKFTLEIDHLQEDGGVSTETVTMYVIQAGGDIQITAYDKPFHIGEDDEVRTRLFEGYIPEFDESNPDDVIYNLIKDYAESVKQ